MSRKTIVRLIGLGALVAFGLWLAGGVTSVEAAAPLQVTPLPPGDQQLGKPVTLGAKVVDTTTNRAVNNVEVTFYVQTDVFGPRLMNVGKAATDATGTAYVSYKPSWVGDTVVVARVLASSQYSAAEGKFTFSAIGPARVHQNADFGLDSIRAVAPAGVIVLVVLVWGALCFTLLHTVRGIAFADAREAPQGSTARRRRVQTAEE